MAEGADPLFTVSLAEESSMLPIMVREAIVCNIKDLL